MSGLGFFTVSSVFGSPVFSCPQISDLSLNLKPEARNLDLDGQLKMSWYQRIRRCTSPLRPSTSVVHANQHTDGALAMVMVWQPIPLSTLVTVS